MDAGTGPSGMAGQRGDVLRIGPDALAGFGESCAAMARALRELSEIADPGTARAARRLAAQLAAIEIPVTMIGQVKAGKTSLVNAMVGWPDLLPADVNPWTSVVTSLHLSPHAAEGDDRSSFTFFDEEEWTRLLDRGGRIGELAARAGAESELEKVRQQIAAMREKSRDRLGRKFEMLLGQTHDYGYVDPRLVERYVCLGDDFGEDADSSEMQGRFADITKSADLFIRRPSLPVPLCLRDTPGVNDTFMMREQITIRAIRDSRICVVVLAAHQAMSSVDLALIRLIANVRSRDVVIFVNRVDELDDPVSQVPEIEAGIRRTLADHKGPADAEIVFGSAYWATLAVRGDTDRMEEASARSLAAWAGGSNGLGRPAAGAEDVWHLSGVPALYGALAARIEEGPGAEALERISRRAGNLATGLKASARSAAAPTGATEAALDPARLGVEIAQIDDRAKSNLAARLDAVEADFDKRLQRSHAAFLDRATAALIEHLEAYGDGEPWRYDPTGLRVLLRTAYQVYARGAKSAADEAFGATTTALAGLYPRLLGAAGSDVVVAPPPAPVAAPPVHLGQTIALDLEGNWWTRWWRSRRGYATYAADFSAMIQAETEPVVRALKDNHAASFRREAEAALAEFVGDQRTQLAHLAQATAMDADALRDRLRAGSARLAAIDDAIAAFARRAA